MTSTSTFEDVQFERSSLLIDAGRHAEARAEIAKGLQQLPGSSRLRLQLAFLELEMRHYAAVTHIVRDVLATDHQNEWALRLQAEAAIGANRPKEAIGAATRAAWLTNSSPASLFILARAQSIDRQHRAALETALRRQSDCPLDPWSWSLLGDVHRRAGNYAEAEQAYRECLRLDPRHAGALAELGNTLGAVGRSDEAVEMLTRAAGMDPTGINPTSTLAWVVHSEVRRSAGSRQGRIAKARLLEKVPEAARERVASAVSSREQYERDRVAVLRYAARRRRRLRQKSVSGLTVTLLLAGTFFRMMNTASRPIDNPVPPPVQPSGVTIQQGTQPSNSPVPVVVAVAPISAPGPMVTLPPSPPTAMPGTERG